MKIFFERNDYATELTCFSGCLKFDVNRSVILLRLYVIARPHVAVLRIEHLISTLDVFDL